MSAIVKSDPNGIAQLDVASELPAIFSLAKALEKAPGFMPSHLRNAGEITAVVLAGRELGIPPMAAIRSIKLIKGNVTLDASMQLALMVRAGCKVKWLDDGSSGVARLQLERPGQEPHISRFSMEDAKNAGLAGSDNWRKHPAAMLRARCVTSAGKAYCPDVLAGVYLPDELPAPTHQAVPADIATFPNLVDNESYAYDQATAEIGEYDTATGELGPPSDATHEPEPYVERAAKAADDDRAGKQTQASELVSQLPSCSTAEELKVWATMLVNVAGKVGSKGPGKDAWKAFAERCRQLELQPGDVIAGVPGAR